MRLAAGEEQAAIDRAVEELGLAFQISTRLTSWVAVSEEATVDPSKPIRRERMPGELPHGMSVEGLGLRSSPALAMVAAGAPTRLFRAALASAPGISMNQRGRGFSVLRRSLEPASPPPPRAPEVLMDVEEESPRPAPTCTLPAVLRLLRKGELVLEVSVTDEALAWDAPATAKLRLDDGSTQEVEVDRRKTTGAGNLTPPQSLRLVLRAPSVAIEKIASVVLEVGDVLLVLDVRH